MGSTGSRVFDIGENTGVLKNKLYKSGLGHLIKIMSPTSVKKGFAGKGNVGKPEMCEAFKTQTGIDLAALFGCPPAKAMDNDIADAYANLRAADT